MHPSFEIDARVRSYLDRSISLADLREWFRRTAGALFDLPESSDAVELGAALQLAFIEYDKGGFTERQLKLYLRQVIKDSLQVLVQAPPRVDASPVLTSSSNETISTSTLLQRDATTTVITIQLIPTGTSS